MNKIKCILLCTNANAWYYDMLLSCRDLEIYHLDFSILELDIPNPYNLKTTTESKVCFVCKEWLKRITTKYSINNTEFLINKLRKISNVVVGVEPQDFVRLHFSPTEINQFDFILKATGLYTDRELYNYNVGPTFKDNNWNKKEVASKYHYSNNELDKMYLSLPCFLGINPEIRYRVRKIHNKSILRNYASRIMDECLQVYSSFSNKKIVKSRKLQGNFTGSLTHKQRVELVLKLKSEHIEGVFKLTDIPICIGGIDEDLRQTDKTIIASYKDILVKENLLTHKTNRYSFLYNLINSDYIIAPTGYGELSFRQGEAWANSKLLICQDMSHIQTMFPIKNYHNVIYCNVNFSDIKKIVTDIEKAKIDANKIAQQGFIDWRIWTKDIDGLLYSGITQHLIKFL